MFVEGLGWGLPSEGLSVSGSPPWTRENKLAPSERAPECCLLRRISVRQVDQFIQPGGPVQAGNSWSAPDQARSGSVWRVLTANRFQELMATMVISRETISFSGNCTVASCQVVSDTPDWPMRVTSSVRARAAR